MTEMKRIMSLAGVAVVLLAACAHHSTSGGGASPGAGAGSGGLQVEAKTVTGVGNVLVDGSSGKTLYLLSAEAGGKVTCTGGCASIWPPLLLPAGTSAAAAGSGAQSSMLGTAKVPGGGVEVTYGGWPLHLFQGDSGPGQANGEGIHSFGGVWDAVTTAGQPAVSTASTPSSGYGY